MYSDKVRYIEQKYSNLKTGIFTDAETRRILHQAQIAVSLSE